MTHREAFFSSLFLGLCAAGLASLFSSFSFIIAFNFFSTIGGYLFLRKQEFPLSRFYSRLFEWTSVVSIVGSILCLFEIDEGLWWIFLVNSMFTLLYFQPQRISLRASTWLKPISIATAWTLNVCVLAHYQGVRFEPNDYSVFITILGFWALTFFLSLYYDLKDAATERDINSLAVKWGLRKTTRLGISSILIICVMQYFIQLDISKEITALLGAAIYMLFIDYCIQKNKANTYIVDGAYVVYFLIFTTKLFLR
jgi:hypothetical protein